jgi:hypothetical protein
LHASVGAIMAGRTNKVMKGRSKRIFGEIWNVVLLMGFV